METVARPLPINAQTRPLRALHLYSGNLFGGVERLLVTIAEAAALVPEWESEFALCFRGRLWDELSSAQARIHDLGNVQLRNVWSVVRSRRRLAQLLAREPFDVVIAHANWPQALFGAVAQRAGLPVVNWVHDGLGGRSWTERWAAWTRPDHLLVNSRFTASTVDRVFPGVPRDVVYLPVKCDRSAATSTESAESSSSGKASTSRQRMRSAIGAGDNTVVILQVSRWEPWKGHRQHVEALSRLPQDLDWQLWIAGGPQKPAEHVLYDEVQRLAETLGLAVRVRLLGQRRDIPDLMAAADVFCQPNTGPEPFGIVFVEALAAGLPIVTTNIGGGAEIVTSDTGRLVPPNDPIPLAHALQELIEQPQLRQTLGQAGPSRARELCDPKQQLSQIASILAAVCASRRRRG